MRHVGSSSGEREYLHRSLLVSVDGAFNRLPGLHGDSRGRQQYFKWNQGYPVDVCVCSHYQQSVRQLRILSVCSAVSKLGTL